MSPSDDMRDTISQDLEKWKKVETPAEIIIVTQSFIVFIG